MNPFSPGDRVQCKTKSRRNGYVIYTYCGECEKCKLKFFTDCTNEPLNKVKVLASFPVDSSSSKRFRYDYTELDFEVPLPFKKERRLADLSPRDIRPLGSIKLDIPLIVAEGDEDEPEIEVEEVEPIVVRELDKPARGMLLEEYIGLSQKMNRPI